MVRHADIGSAKPSAAERARYPYRLMDFLEPDQPFSAADFLAALKNLKDNHTAETLFVFIGGSHFYLRVLLTGMWEAPPTSEEQRHRLEMVSTQELFERVQAKDPVSAKRIGPQDRYRLTRALALIEATDQPLSQLKTMIPFPDVNFEVHWLDRDPEALKKRIQIRTRLLLAQGWIDEVRKLISLFPQSEVLSTVGYQQIKDYLEQKLPKGRQISPGVKGLEEEITLATQQLSRKQRQFIRRLSTTVDSSRATITSTILDQEISVQSLQARLESFL